MKTALRTNLLLFSVLMIFCMISPAVAQKKETGRFASVNLVQLKNTLHKNLIKDGVIKNRKEEFYLSIKYHSIELNDKEFNEKMTLKYRSILSEFEIGEGPDRKVYVSPKGVAVGDFTKKGFHGKVRGTFRDNVLSAE